MLFHLSITADDPERVARAIAKLWRGEALPFPQGERGSWMAMAGDERNSAVEIYPRGYVLTPSTERDEKWPDGEKERRRSGTHAAIATPLSKDEVIAIAEQEGWFARYLRRGDKFGLVEVWIENATLFEVLTPEMQAEYLETQTLEKWRELVGVAKAEPKREAQT